MLIFVALNLGLFSFRGGKTPIVFDEIRALERIPESCVVV
jgi:hypothetical protein